MLQEAPSSAPSRFHADGSWKRLDLAAVAVLLLATIALAAESFAASLSFDELLTWVTARLATPALIWRSLKIAPLPLDPPLYHWIDHFSIVLFGDSDLAVRLPSAIGMIATLWLIYAFTRRVGGRAAGLVAMSIAVASGAFDYGSNARPYALVLAATAGALVSWQNTVRGPTRRSSVIGFACCLALANSLHYYSVLIVIPFAAGELVRLLRTRRVEWPVLAAMFLGCAAMLLYLPLIPATKAYQLNYWRGVRASDILASYSMLYRSLRVVGPLLALLAAAYFLKRRRSPPRPVEQSLKAEETAVLATFALYPLVVFALSLAVTHTFAERFTVPAVFGLAILPALALRSLLNRDSAVLIVAALILCYVPVHALQSLRSGAAGLKYSPELARQTAVFKRLPDTSKIVVSDVVTYLKTLKYAPAPVSRRVVLLDFAEGPSAAGRRDTGEMVALGVRKGIGLPTVTPGTLRDFREPFFLVCCGAGHPLDTRLQHAVERSGNDLESSVGTYWYSPVRVMRPFPPAASQ